jgi:hypothetical protein
MMGGLGRFLDRADERRAWPVSPATSDWRQFGSIEKETLFASA